MHITQLCPVRGTLCRRVCATMPMDGFVYFVYYVHVSEQASARAYATIDETCTMSLFNYNNYAVKNEALNQIVFLAHACTQITMNLVACAWAQGRNSAKQSFAQEVWMPYRILTRAHAHTLKSIRLRPNIASTHNKNLQFSFVPLHDNIRWSWLMRRGRGGGGMEKSLNQSHKLDPCVSFKCTVRSVALSLEPSIE